MDEPTGEPCRAGPARFACRTDDRRRVDPGGSRGVDAFRGFVRPVRGGSPDPIRGRRREPHEALGGCQVGPVGQAGGVADADRRPRGRRQGAAFSARRGHPARAGGPARASGRGLAPGPVPGRDRRGPLPVAAGAATFAPAAHAAPATVGIRPGVGVCLRWRGPGRRPGRSRGAGQPEPGHDQGQARERAAPSGVGDLAGGASQRGPALLRGDRGRRWAGRAAMIPARTRRRQPSRRARSRAAFTSRGPGAAASTRARPGRGTGSLRGRRRA